MSYMKAIRSGILQHRKFFAEGAKPISLAVINAAISALADHQAAETPIVKVSESLPVASWVRMPM
jgi:hypothetical protein